LSINLLSINILNYLLILKFVIQKSKLIGQIIEDIV